MTPPYTWEVRRSLSGVRLELKQKQSNGRSHPPIRKSTRDRCISA
ncbi:hypothetical protein [Phormidium pseudopriestleyi]|nr:hypothetical protein [Phormidium pseudopriestleyi]